MPSRWKAFALSPYRWRQPPLVYSSARSIRTRFWRVSSPNAVEADDPTDVDQDDPTNAALIQLVPMDLATTGPATVLVHQHQQLVSQRLAWLLPYEVLEIAVRQSVQARPLGARQGPRPLRKLPINRNRQVLRHTRIMRPYIMCINSGDDEAEHLVLKGGAGSPYAAGTDDDDLDAQA